MIDVWRGERFRLYCLGDDGKPEGIAECSTAEAVGLALVTIAEENRLAGEPAETVGVLDWQNHRWLTSIWGSRRAVPFA